MIIVLIVIFTCLLTLSAVPLPMSFSFSVDFNKAIFSYSAVCIARVSGSSDDVKKSVKKRQQKESSKPKEKQKPLISINPKLISRVYHSLQFKRLTALYTVPCEDIKSSVQAVLLFNSLSSIIMSIINTTNDGVELYSNADISISEQSTLFVEGLVVFNIFALFIIGIMAIFDKKASN